MVLTPGVEVLVSNVPATHQNNQKMYFASKCLHVLYHQDVSTIQVPSIAELLSQLNNLTANLLFTICFSIWFAVFYLFVFLFQT